MPTPPISYALINLYKCDGAPWQWPAWQKLTGVHHGLFPDDDTLLPNDLTRKDVLEIKSYFDRFLAEPEEKRLKLHNEKAGVVPGRDKWKKWVTAASRQWKLHSVVVDAFKENNINPNEIVRAGQLTDWPDARSYITSALDSLGTTLFGDESLDDIGHLCNPLRSSASTIAQISWNLLRVQHTRAGKKLTAAEEAAMTALEEASGDNPTTATFASAIKAMAKWRNIAEVCGGSQELAKIGKNLEELEELMASVGAVINSDVKADRKSTTAAKSRNRNALHLASTADIDYLIRLYDDILDVSEDDSPPLQDEPLFDVGFAAVEGSQSLGVDYETCLSPDQLADQLGFVDGLPFLFNRFRHKTGFVVWNKPTLFDDPDSNPDIVPLHLHWHQLAGLHAIVRHCFTSGPTKDTNVGILVADDVGLGKTGMAISTIAFLAHLINLKGTVDHLVPKAIQRRPFFGEKDVLPDLCHLIVVPGTLLAQWISEIQTFFKKHVVEILVYPKKLAERVAFWAPDGPYEMSKHFPTQRIIIASHSALLQDYSSTFKSRKGGTKLPWDLPSPKLDAKRENTLFGKQYLTFVLDEAHLLRNIGAKHFSALRIRERSLITLALTATPVQTKTGDAAAMGRLLGIPYFLSAQAHDDEKADAAALRKAKKEVLEMDDDHFPSENNHVRRIHVNAALRMQREFEGRIIRRTTQSIDWRGNNLLDLPPINRIKAVVKLSDREMKVINTLAESAKENVSAANAAGKFLTNKFYVDYRMACAFAWEGSAPKISSSRDWAVCRSTKMEVTARIIQHHLTRDDAPPVAFENGFPVFPLFSPSPIFTRTMKIVIFQLFPSLREPLAQCLALYGIEWKAIDGAKSYEVRANIVAAFKESTTCKVLIISSVGSAGLNLAFCNCVIYIDQTWSSQDERQIDGRVWRQPQDKNVIIYHVLADQTSDIMLSSMASTKRDMLDAFLDKNTGEELMQLLSGKTIQGDDSDAEEDRHEDLSVSKRKSTSSLHSIQSSDKHGVEEMPQKGKRGKQQRSKRQRKVAKSPLVVAEPEEPVPVDDTATEGGGMSDAFTSGGESGRTSDAFGSEGEESSSSMNFNMDDLNIDEDPQDVTPMPPPQAAKSHQYRNYTKRPRQSSPPTAQSAANVSTLEEAPAKVMRMGLDHFSAQRARSGIVQGSEVASKRLPPVGGSQNLNPFRRQAYQQPDVNMISNKSSHSVAGPSTARRSTPIHATNASLLTPPAQPFGAPSANKKAQESLRGAAPIGGKNFLKATSKTPRAASSGFRYEIRPE